jgi:hypothetical protein
LKPRRDASFWAPLDQQFLVAVARSPQLAGFEYISPFWTTYFFSHVDYDTSTAQLSYSEQYARVSKAAAQNMLADQFSSTGEFYRKMTVVQSSTLSSTATTVTSMTTESGRRITGFLIVGIVTGIAIGP